MNFVGIRNAIENALLLYVRGIQARGIADAAIKKVAISSEQLQRIANQVEHRGYSDFALSAEIDLFLAISDSDVLQSTEHAQFRLRLNADKNAFHALATSDQDWNKAWERGIEPLRQPALQSMKEDIWEVDPTLTEESYAFQAAMVLLASEMTGPYTGRLTTFLGYPSSVVQVMAARLRDAKIWEDDRVNCESWFDPKRGGANFLLAIMIAEGKIERSWSEEKQDFIYNVPDVRDISRYVV